MKKSFLVGGLLFLSIIVRAQISIGVFGNAYSENFNTLVSSGTGSTVPAGWAFLESGLSANLLYSAGTGSGTSGDTYSFGLASNTERAFGQLRSGSVISVLGANYINNTGSTIIALTISYTGEQWRLGALSRLDRMDFQYSLNATSLTTGTWIDVNTLDFVAPVTSGTIGSLDGNLPGNSVLVSSSILGLSIPNGNSFWIRWTDLDAAGSDDGLGVDDFSLLAPPNTPTPVDLISFTGENEGSHNKLSWTTATETHNHGFVILRSLNGINYQAIGFVRSHAIDGNSNDLLHYSFLDDAVVSTHQYYRIRQEDIDGNSKLSAILLIRGKSIRLSIAAIYPNPVVTALNIFIFAPVKDKLKIIVLDISGRMVLQRTANVTSGNNSVKLDMSGLSPGNYIVKLIGNEDAVPSMTRFIKL